MPPGGFLFRGTAGVLPLLQYARTLTRLVREKVGRDRDNIFLILWIAGVLVYSILLLPYASTRYLLPLFPPVVLMFVRYARGNHRGQSRWLPFRRGHRGLHRRRRSGRVDSRLPACRSLSRLRHQTTRQELQADGHRLWFAGEFGLRYYLEAEGGRYLTKDDNSPAAGDRVVLSHGLIAYFISDDLKNRLQLERSVDYPSAWPVRVEDPGSQAGFYDQFHGNLPWSLSSRPMETIDIYTVRVVRSADIIP